MWGIKLSVIRHAVSISIIIFSFWELFADLHHYIGRFFRNMTVFTKIYNIWWCGVSNYRWYGMLNPNTWSFLAFKNFISILADFSGIWQLLQKCIPYSHVRYQIIDNHVCWIHILSHFCLLKTFLPIYITILADFTKMYAI